MFNNCLLMFDDISLRYGCSLVNDSFRCIREDGRIFRLYVNEGSWKHVFCRHGKNVIILLQFQQDSMVGVSFYCLVLFKSSSWPPLSRQKTAYIDQQKAHACNTVQCRSHLSSSLYYLSSFGEGNHNLPCNVLHSSWDLSIVKALNHQI